MAGFQFEEDVFPRLPTAVMSELRSWRSKAGREMSGAIRFEIQFGGEDAPPGDKWRQSSTTCSTSGSSGMKTNGLTGLIPFDDLLDLLFDLIHQFRFARFDIQTQQWLGVRARMLKRHSGVSSE